MKKIIPCLLLVYLLVFSNTVLASNWVWVGKSNELAISNYDIYLDKDSVMKNGNHIIFWELRKFDKEDELELQQELIKLEAITSTPRQCKGRDYYAYTASNKLIYHLPDPPGFPLEFGLVAPYSIIDKTIDAALQYAKEGKDSGQKPILPLK